MIERSFYKDRPCVEIKSKKLSAKFLYEDGGKLASLTFNSKEYLAKRDSKNYLRLFKDTSYVKSECSGFDDMFPTIDPCVIGGLTYVDHGEVCRKPFSLKIDKDFFSLSCYADNVNVVFSKTISIENDSLVIKYLIENKNDFLLPYIWAGHIMLRGEEGAYVTSLFDETAPYTVCFGNPPKNKNVLQAYGENKEYKFYYDNKKSPISCSVVYPSANEKLNFSFDNGVVGYLGLWFNPGDLNGTYSLAVEPCTAPYDTPLKAEEKKKGSTIDKLSKVEFTLKITLTEV